jgi:hypothetical protein
LKQQAVAEPSKHAALSLESGIASQKTILAIFLFEKRNKNAKNNGDKFIIMQIKMNQESIAKLSERHRLRLKSDYYFRKQ